MSAVLVFAFLGIMYSLFSLVRGAVSKDPGVEGKPITSEVFPTIEVLEQKAVVEAEPGKKEVRRKYTVKEHPVSVTVPQSGNLSPETAPAVKEGKKSLLKGKSDIRKAIIYSEILNRKY